MDYANLGRTGLRVSRLCLGTMQWGWTATEEESRAVMDAFFEAGGNFLDTANVYSWWAGNPRGISEEIIGRWLKDRGNRHGMVIATKVRQRMGEGPNDEGLSRKHIMAAVEGSLRRLQTDYIDLYQAHNFDANAPIEETMRALDDLVQQGKILYVGASNYPAWRLAQALGASADHGWVRYESLQPHYNLIHRGEFERELKPLCEDQGLGVMPYSPLAGGFLTGKYQRGQPLPASQRADGIQRRYFDDAGAWEVLTAAEDIARRSDKTVSQVALAWLLDQPVITSPIVGANTLSQLQENLGALGFHLATGDRQRLDEASGGPYEWND